MTNRLALAAMAVALVACTSKEPKPNDSARAAASAAPPAPNQVTITAKDFAFELPDTIPAGITTIRLVNQGTTLHHAQLLRLEQGKTLEDLMTGFKAMKPGQAPPAWVVPVGGPNTPSPGGEASITQNLDAGNYAVVCFVDIPDHVPHIMKGMAKALVVKPSTTAAAPEPSADITMKLSDYAFDVSTPLTAGKHVIRVDNAGPQQHEVWIAKMDSSKTLKDLLAFAKSYKGKLPATGMGGVASILPGAHAFVNVDLTPGDYVLMCFVPDSKNGQPHFMHGMAKEIKIS